MTCEIIVRDVFAAGLIGKFVFSRSIALDSVQFFQDVFDTGKFTIKRDDDNVYIDSVNSASAFIHSVVPKGLKVTSITKGEYSALTNLTDVEVL